MKKDILEEFAGISSNLLQKIATEEKENITLAAKKTAKAFLDGKKIYIFGCTHSAILAEDVFYRAELRPGGGTELTASDYEGVAKFVIIGEKLDRRALRAIFR